MAVPVRARPVTFLAAFVMLVCLCLLTHISTVQADPLLNLETLTGGEAEKLLEEGKLTSVELVKLKARTLGPAYMVSKVFPNPGLSGAPSETFQADWRCVPGSAFFKPYDCNPGELENPLPGLEHNPF
jgi:hypothetical protein